MIFTFLASCVIDHKDFICELLIEAQFSVAFICHRCKDEVVELANDDERNEVTNQVERVSKTAQNRNITQFNHQTSDDHHEWCQERQE